MARNSEKAMTALARWRAAQEGATLVKERRPYLATECDDLGKAEKWRRQIIGEITRKVAQIQNAGLGEFKLRDLNDEINKLLREKRHWEDRILELGGPNYKKTGPRMMDKEGKEVPGNRGYKYFGAAKDLPGVRELFQAEPPKAPRKTRAELMKDIDADYYGYRDEDDGVLVPLEREAERKAQHDLLMAYKEKKEKALREGKAEVMETEEEENIYAVSDNESDEDTKTSDSTRKKQKVEEPSQFIAHVPVPSQKEIEAALVHRKKMELLQKYASESLQSEEESVKEMLGVQSQ